MPALIASEVIRLDGAGLQLVGRRWPGPAGALPLVLLHGLTESSASWETVAPVLARRRSVYAWDARGHGSSDWAADAAYAGDAHFADVARALDALGLQHCALAGFSMGGGVALLTAGALPERVARLIVVDAYPDPEMSPGSRQIAEYLATLVLQPHRAGWGAGTRPPFDPAIARAFAEELARDDARRLDLWPFWEAGEQPALLVRGAFSAVLTESMAAEMLRRRATAQLVTIPGVAHAVPAMQPGLLTSAIDAFLDDC